MLRNGDGGGGCVSNFPEKKHYEGVRFTIIRVRGRSQLSTFMKAYTAYARGEGGGGLGLPYAFFPENQLLILITDNVL